MTNATMSTGGATAPAAVPIASASPMQVDWRGGPTPTKQWVVDPDFRRYSSPPRVTIIERSLSTNQFLGEFESSRRYLHLETHESPARRHLEPASGNAGDSIRGQTRFAEYDVDVRFWPLAGNRANNHENPGALFGILALALSAATPCRGCDAVLGWLNYCSLVEIIRAIYAHGSQQRWVHRFCFLRAGLASRRGPFRGRQPIFNLAVWREQH
jgi:hypothetical protein